MNTVEKKCYDVWVTYGRQDENWLSEMLNTDLVGLGILYQEWDEITGQWSADKAEYLIELFEQYEKENKMTFKDVKLYQVFKEKDKDDLYAKIGDKASFVFKSDSSLGWQHSYSNVFEVTEIYEVRAGSLGNLMSSFIEQDFSGLALVSKAEDKYDELSKGDICEVWDDGDEDVDRELLYYDGNKEFVSNKRFIGDVYESVPMDNFKLIKKAE